MKEGATFWSLLDADDRHALERVATRRSYPRGSVVLHHGDDSTSVLVLLEGRVKITADTIDGHEALLAFRGPGDVVGELGAIDGQPRAASVTTLEPVTALACAASEFRALLTSRPAIGVALLQLVVERLRGADAERAEFGAHDVLGRVALRLCALADRFGAEQDAGIEITLPLTQEELASWCGASREAVAKGLNTMRSLGWIETRRRAIVVTDIDALRTYAG